MSEIHFNSKFSNPQGYTELSNFYGGVEFEYMVQRFNQAEILNLFRHLRTCGNEEFWRWLQILNRKGTKKKPVTLRQKDYWFRGGVEEGKPIRGIAAQMLGTMVRPSAEKRRKAVMKVLGIRRIDLNKELSDENKQRWMKTCLHRKYENPYFRALLLSTGNAILHETPLRGKGARNNWTFKAIGGEVYGKDWLGQLLMEVREEITLPLKNTGSSD
jgi:hypothetical protein